MTDYQQHEIEGKDLCFMQGALTDSVSLKHVRIRLENYQTYVSFCLRMRYLTHLCGLKSDDVQCTTDWIRKSQRYKLHQKWKAFSL